MTGKVLFYKHEKKNISFNTERCPESRWYLGRKDTNQYHNSKKSSIQLHELIP